MFSQVPVCPQRVPGGGEVPQSGHRSLLVELHWSKSDIYLPVVCLHWVAMSSDKDQREFSLSRSLQYNSTLRGYPTVSDPGSLLGGGGFLDRIQDTPPPTG